MKKNVTLEMFKKGFIDYNRDYFSYEGYEVLYNYLIELEISCDFEIDFDVIAIICDFVEYESVEECLNDYDMNTIEDLEDETTVLLLENDGIIIHTF
jgi:hypothetical protein